MGSARIPYLLTTKGRIALAVAEINEAFTDHIGETAMGNRTAEQLTPIGHIKEFLTCAQKQWLAIMDGANLPPDQMAPHIGLALSYFSTAWYLKALNDIAPDKAAEASARLQEILDSGDGVGYSIWDMLTALGVDPATIKPAGVPDDALVTVAVPSGVFL